MLTGILLQKVSPRMADLQHDPEDFTTVILLSPKWALHCISPLNIERIRGKGCGCMYVWSSYPDTLGSQLTSWGSLLEKRGCGLGPICLSRFSLS